MDLLLRAVRKLRNDWWKIFFVVSGLCLGIFVLFLFFYPVSGFIENSIAESTKIYDRNGILLYETLNPKQGKTTWVALEDIPQFLRDATIATEDKNFYDHSGVDFFGIARALYLNMREGRVVSGGSTIPQQLVRNIIGTEKKRTVLQKIKETLLALRISRAYAKDEILEAYLNKIYYGNLNYGVTAASHGYFGKHVRDLDLAESAFLAGLPQAPNRYDPFKNRDSAQQRKNYVLTLMHRHELISAEQLEQAQNEKLAFENNLVTIRAPHAVNDVIEQLEELFGESFVTQGLSVHTTIDYHLQQKVQEIARSQIDALVGRNVTNASVVVLEPRDASIRVMLGSVDYFDKKIDGNVNIATSARQPGSAMKPITYAVAFEKGWHGATRITDEPVRYFTADGNPYLPKNFDFTYHGTVTARIALANSYNIPAVKAIDFATVPAVLEKARAFGLSTLTKSPDHYGLALTLGAGEVRLLDLSSAFMVFANGGIKRTPQLIEEVRDSSGKQIYSRPLDPGNRVVDERIAYMIGDILSDNEARIEQFGVGNVLEIGRPAAVKTGTSRNFRDNWTLGYTPDYVVGVWVGNNDNSAMRYTSGIHGAGPIWHDVMTELHRKLPIAEFKKPDGLIKASFCANEECTKRVSEWIPEERAAMAQNETQESEAKPVRIVKPFDRDVFQYLPHVAADAQQIKLEAAVARGTGKIRWFVDAVEIGRGSNIFWKLAPGRHTIRAESGVAHDEIEITVEE